jgi:hypothetical protein
MLPGMEFVMPKNAAIKNAARERQAQTGESYTEARAAVVAEHDDKPEPLLIELWFPEMFGQFELDTPEARKAWRELDELPRNRDRNEALDNFAREHLGEGVAALAASLATHELNDGRVPVNEGEADDYTMAAEWRYQGDLANRAARLGYRLLFAGGNFVLIHVASLNEDARVGGLPTFAQLPTFHQAHEVGAHLDEIERAAKDD